MTKETIASALDMINKGYNLNQVAAILMVDRVALIDAINGASGIYAPPIAKTTKKVETKIEPMFEEEEGL